ncbi:MAG TPA: double-strand break repair protein AddB [Hellea balneolensis]|uniref:Double-strand break repair protein AddB n=1 Tax=Hellea balneolensis TaxID=287478 RepID=A0A7C3GM16_9PROT|nr:double-strand break repair protein AddB [Hellea balneolensis]
MNVKPLSPDKLFTPAHACVYTMPAGLPFLQNLAATLIKSLGADLSTALILLPTRRAIRMLAQAFIDQAHGEALLLPMMRTLADMDENEPPFAPAHIDIAIPPAIDANRAPFELARLIVHKMRKEHEQSGEEHIDAASALAMGEPLAQLMADLAMEELGTDVFRTLDDKFDTLPAHFQDAAVFAKLVSTYWPRHLAEQGLTDPMARRVALLNAASDIWNEKPPTHPVIIAGSTGSLAATARLMKTVANLPKGVVVLPGLDTHLDEVAWDSVDDQHPQASLKRLLETLELERKHVPPWPGADITQKNRMRRRLLSESLVPAISTSDWPGRIVSMRTDISKGDPIKNGLEGLSLIEAKTEEEEAAVIALILRGVLEDLDTTAALVTPDPSLARRVRSKLSRWDIDIDNSAGEPLEETLIGSFLSLSAQAAEDPFNPVTLSALVKHRLFTGYSGDIRTIWDGFEKTVLRGPRLRSWEAITEKFNRRKRDRATQDGFDLFQHLIETLTPLHTIMKTAEHVRTYTQAHTQLIEILTGGAEKIWVGPAGEQAASLLEELILYGDLLPNVNAYSYQKLISQRMRSRVVRPRFGMQDRIQILGPLEARMVDADLFILGGLNEGVWPAGPTPHPILSPAMRKALGLGAAERRFGLGAHDFAQLAAHPHVIMTRAQRSADGPSVQSRWLWRLTTLVRGALVTPETRDTDNLAQKILAPEKPWLDWTRALDQAPSHPQSAQRPEPRPALDARWPKKRGLSVTQIKTWVRDPYAIYAKHILGLKPIDPLDQNIGGREVGIAVHSALEKIDALNEAGLKAALLDELHRAGVPAHSFARFDQRMSRMAGWLIGWAKQRTQKGWTKSGIEERGILEIETPHGPFTLTGIADRIEKKGGDIAVMDFKTGILPTAKAIQAGFDPQLPLLAMMIEAGALGAKGSVSDMLYIKPNASQEKDREKFITGKNWDTQTYTEKTREDLDKLIAHFDREDSAYYAQPRAQYVNTYGDYDHLSRRTEWAVLGPEGGDKG